MYKDTVTLFCRKPGSQLEGDIWYPTVIRNVNLNIDRASIASTYGAESQDNAILNIRYKRDGENILVSGKPWTPPKEWDQTEDSLTFTSGNNFDFFWKGEWDGGIVRDSDYSASNGFFNYMNRDYDYVFSITSVSMFSVIPHFEITGK